MKTAVPILYESPRVGVMEITDLDYRLIIERLATEKKQTRVRKIDLGNIVHVFVEVVTIYDEYYRLEIVYDRIRRDLSSVNVVYQPPSGRIVILPEQPN